VILAGVAGFFFSKRWPRPNLSSTKSPIQPLLGLISLGLNQPKLEGNHSPPSSVYITKELSYTSTSSACLLGLEEDKYLHSH
jgi:hypothetical protein